MVKLKRNEFPAPLAYGHFLNGTAPAPLEFVPIGRVDFASTATQLTPMNNIFSRFSSAQLKRAAAIREQIEQKEKELTALLGIPEALTVGGMARRHRRVSAATRAKLSAMAKARWAKIKAKKN